MKRTFNLIYAILILLIFSSSIHAQVVGQIFTKEEANKKYGPVKEFVTFPARELQIILNKANDYVMFNILDKQLYILNSKREVLFPSGAKVDEQQVFYYFSKSIIEGLLNFVERQPNVQVELREDVLSITSGNFTLEQIIPCPPFCP